MSDRNAPDGEGWGGHQWTDCAKDCLGCMLCDGGLALCSICGGLEGALLEQCPGHRLTAEEHDANYADYCRRSKANNERIRAKRIDQ